MKFAKGAAKICKGGMSDAKSREGGIGRRTRPRPIAH